MQIDLQTFLRGHYGIQDSKVHLGTVGSTVNISNLIAAVFIATGQDPASVTECGNGLLIIRPATQDEIETHGKERCTKPVHVLHYMITDCGTVGSFFSNLDLVPDSSVQVSHLF